MTVVSACVGCVTCGMLARYDFECYASTSSCMLCELRLTLLTSPKSIHSSKYRFQHLVGLWFSALGLLPSRESAFLLLNFMSIPVHPLLCLAYSTPHITALFLFLHSFSLFLPMFPSFKPYLSRSTSFELPQSKKLAISAIPRPCATETKHTGLAAEKCTSSFYFEEGL